MKFMGDFLWEWAKTLAFAVLFFVVCTVLYGLISSCALLAGYYLSNKIVGTATAVVSIVTAFVALCTSIGRAKTGRIR